MRTSIKRFIKNYPEEGKRRFPRSYAKLFDKEIKKENNKLKNLRKR